MATSKINKIGKLDYSQASRITSLPYTPSKDGIIIYTVGASGVSGERAIEINGVEVGRFSGSGRTTITAFINAGDTLTSAGGLTIWGDLKFIPFG